MTLYKKISVCCIFLVLLSYTGVVCAACIGLGCTCRIGATAVNFGAYNPINGSPISSTGTVSVTCSALIAGLNVSYVMALNKGNGASFTPRVMKNGINQLNYNLYTNSARTLIWGDGTSGTQTVSDSYFLNIISRTRDYTAYALLPASQNVIPGIYTDTITATVTF